MGTSSRFIAALAVMLFVAVVDIDAFTSSVVVQRVGRQHFGHVLRGAPRTTSLSFGLNIERRASRGAVMMSEMSEDYPSDTGDDRFSAGGEHVRQPVHKYIGRVDLNKRLCNLTASMVLSCEVLIVLPPPPPLCYIHCKLNPFTQGRNESSPPGCFSEWND